MKWLTDKGASLGFTITAALLAAILICALFVSCGKTHSSGVGAGLRPALASPGRAGLRPAPTTGNERSLDPVLAQVDAYVPPTGVDAARFASLKAELKRLLIERDRRGEAVPRPRATHRVAPTTAEKTISLAPTGSMNAVTDLAATVNPGGTQATLTWTEVLPGDYDNDGVVDITDIIPVALYYGQRTDSGPNDAHRLVNGDFNPEINIWDLGAIAGNYGAHLDGYQVWRGRFNGTTIDWEATFRPNTNPANSAWSADRSSPPPVSVRPSYTYLDDSSGVAEKNRVRYKVVDYGDGARGAESNVAILPPMFSVAGTVLASGVGLAGAVMTLTPGGLHATTQADGTYAFTVVADGSYTLTPYKRGYAATPAYRTITIATSDVSGLDFIAQAAIGLGNTPCPKKRGNAQNTGQSPYVGAQTNHLKWTSQAGSNSPLIGADGTVYSGATALNPLDGTVKWTCVSSAASAIGADGALYFADGSGCHEVAPYDGSVRWGSLTAGVEPLAIGADGTLFGGSNVGTVYALDPSDGAIEWTFTPYSSVSTPPAIGADSTVYIEDYWGYVYALDPSDGSPKWTRSTGYAQFGTTSGPAIGSDGTIFVGGGEDSVYAFDPLTGGEKWRHTAGDYMGSPPAIGTDGTVYIGVGTGVLALKSENGGQKWWRPTNGLVQSSPTIGADGTVYVGNNGGTVYALSPIDGSIKWTYTAGDLVNSSPAIGADGTVYVGCYDGKLYAFSP